MNAKPTPLERRKALLAIRDASLSREDHRHELIAVMRKMAGKDELDAMVREKAAAILGVSPHTIKSWIKPPTSKSHHRCPAWAVELLKLKIG
jgi:hypothetical protein